MRILGAIGAAAAAAGAAAMAAGAALATETISYSYDALGRLTGASRSGGPNNGLQTSTGYDPAGNRVQHAVGAVSAPASAATFAIASPPAAVNEGQAAVFKVTKSGPAYASLTVNYATVAGTAGASDFTPASGTLTFRAWETERPISVATLVDSLSEPAEQFSVTLSAPSAGASLGTASATATINASTAPPVNHVPVTQNDSASVRVCENVTVNVVANDSDADGDSLTLTSVGNSTRGVGSVSGNQAVFTAYGTTGNTSVTYTVSDGHGGTATGTLFITVLSGTGCN